MSFGRGSPFEAVFASLTEKMGVLHTAAPDTEPSQRDRVDWKDNGGPREPIGYTMPGTVTIGRDAHEHEVSVYGASPLEVDARLRELTGWLDLLVGRHGSAPPPGLEEGWIRHGHKVGSRGPMKGGDGVSVGYGRTVAITLYEPVYSELRPTLTVGEVEFVATAEAGADGTDEGSMEAAIVAEE